MFNLSVFADFHGLTRLTGYPGFKLFALFEDLVLGFVIFKVRAYDVDGC